MINRERLIEEMERTKESMQRERHRRIADISEGMRIDTWEEMQRMCYGAHSIEDVAGLNGLRPRYIVFERDPQAREDVKRRLKERYPDWYENRSSHTEKGRQFIQGRNK